MSPCFLILTPIGLARHAELLGELLARGIALAGEERLDRWAERATAIYQPHPRTAEERARALAYERWWRAHGGEARLLWLAGAVDHARLMACKAELRLIFPSQREGALSLHVFHVPDEEDLAGELLRLRRVG